MTAFQLATSQLESHPQRAGYSRTIMCATMLEHRKRPSGAPFALSGCRRREVGSLPLRLAARPWRPSS